MKITTSPLSHDFFHIAVEPCRVLYLTHRTNTGKDSKKYNNQKIDSTLVPLSQQKQNMTSR